MLRGGTSFRVYGGTHLFYSIEAQRTLGVGRHLTAFHGLAYKCHMGMRVKQGDC